MNLSIDINKKTQTLLFAILIMLLLSISLHFLNLVNLSGFPTMRHLSAILGSMSEETGEAEGLVEDYEEIVEAPVSRNRLYTKTAELGEGLTHVARRAVTEHLSKSNPVSDMTEEHRVYIEDYIQRKMGGGELELGEVVIISEELISEAINSARQLNSNQLENLKQYSALINF